MGSKMTKAPRPFELWVYADPSSATGLRWLPGQKWRPANGQAGGVNKVGGYAVLTIKENGSDVRFVCHKIVYYLKKGVWPEDNQLNHINRNRSDNSIENLEFLNTSYERMQSIQKIDRVNKGPLPRYVSWNTRDKRYQGSIRIEGKRKSLGYSKCVNTLHKKAVDFVNAEYDRKFTYEFVDKCNFCGHCPMLAELREETDHATTGE